jgi:hypothetical protein
MKTLKEQFGAKIVQIAPLVKKETYNDLSTKDIIESINEVKNDTQYFLGTNTLEDLPLNTPRKDAIQISMKMWLHISKRLIHEYKNL